MNGINDRPNTPSTVFDYGIGSSLQLSPNSLVHLSSWTSPRSLLIEHGLMASLYQRPTKLNITMLIQFPFLDKFTKATGFVGSFGCSTKQQRLCIISDPVKANPSRKPTAKEEMRSDAAMHWVEIARNILVQSNGNTANPVALLAVTRKIVDQIRDTAIKQPSRGPTDMTWSPSMEALCYKFFNPTNLHKCLALFWSCWYPNWPTIHAPSFNMREKSPALIAVMALVGACLSPKEQDHASAQIWFDLVEEVVFSDDAFDDEDISNAWRDSTTNHRQSAHLQVLQAVYCVCLYQTWEGSKRSRRRALRQRFNNLVHLARDIGIDQASLKRIDTSHPCGFNWEEYIIRESLIRICSYISNIDASYALFFRHLPRMAPSELVIEMSSPESCFQASSSEECFAELKAWRERMGVNATNLTILGAVNALCNNKIIAMPTTRRAFAHLSVLNMFTFIHALYLQVYSIETSATNGLDVARTTPVANALRNWQQSWPSQTRDAELVDLLRKESDLSTMWQRIGFMRYAPEYWLIAYSSLKKIYTRNNKRSSQISIATIDVGHGHMIDARRLISELRSEDIVSVMDSDTL
ncbi:hypothetical protein G6011_06843 [Alternaria panax]|uniref:Xylanolytic transcriptional activator regulatory domain-containing protein n=1 Tax=Alternaria panax TaxID=48097 RepID=A0AAD4I5U0_9PLEO|nr:hypothetical protein G6011_06843 [Alternaria panax]